MLGKSPTLSPERPFFKCTLISFSPAPFFVPSPELRDQQQAAAWAPPEEKVIMKKTGWRRYGGLAERRRRHQRNKTRVGGDYAPA